MNNIEEKKLNSLSVKITQIKSSIGRRFDQEQTLIGLGLNKLNKSVIIENNSSVGGMIKKVQHLLKIEYLN